MDSHRSQLHELAQVGRAAKDSAERSATRVLDWGERKASKIPAPSRHEMWRGVRTNLISAVLISLVGIAAAAWADRFYAKVGLTRKDAGVSLLRPIAFAFAVGGAVVVTPFAFIALQTVGLRRPGRAFFVFIVAVIGSGLVADQWGSGLAVLAFALVIAVYMLMSIRTHLKRTKRPHLVRAIVYLVLGVLSCGGVVDRYHGSANDVQGVG
jgi:hypothetical protein